MDLMLWILTFIAIIVVILGILAIFFIKKGEGKHKVDYYSLFFMGLVWTLIGILINNFILISLGILFLIVGLINKEKWKKNKPDWSKITKSQKIILYIAFAMLFLLLVSGIIVFWLIQEGIL